jgi:ubiquinone/menaquinone biosynthesis C-methylase UbiE
MNSRENGNRGKKNLKSTHTKISYSLIKSDIESLPNNDNHIIESFLDGLFQDILNETFIDINNQGQWSQNSFDELYMTFDKQRQAFDDNFRLRRNRELDFIVYNSNIKSIKRPVVVEVGIGYGRVAKKLLDELPDIKIKGIDSSKILLNEARKYLRKYREQTELIYCDMRNIFTLGLEKSADLILFIFTTFGYFNDYSNKYVLKSAYSLLKPGGILLIEQYNPYRYIDNSYYIKTYEADFKNIGKIFLIKTSNYKKESDNFTTYSGKYYYFIIDRVDNDKVLIPFRLSKYKICLYFESWFADCINDFGRLSSKVKFDWIFDTGEFSNKRDASLMIAKIEKPI